MTSVRPESDVDIFSHSALENPYPVYAALRAQAAAVWLRPLGMYAVPRYQTVRDALQDWRTFSSASGNAMNDPVNQAISATTLGSDPPLHDRLRRIVAQPLAPMCMREIASALESEAEAVVERLVDAREFDAATELAQHLPVTVVSRLVGLPEEGRERMLDWGTAAFNAVGPDNDLCRAAMPVAMGLVEYAVSSIQPDRLKPGSWAALMFEAADRGEITVQQARGLILDYVGPSLDTTILATSNAIWLFAQHPEQWSALCRNPALIPMAINEVLRLESPIQIFSRLITRDIGVDGIVLPEGSRALMIIGSANRDERKWQDPERFDIGRKAADQLAFGYGEHVCVGLPLARLELRVLLTALAKRVTRFEILNAVRGINNTLRGLTSLRVAVH